MDRNQGRKCPKCGKLSYSHRENADHLAKKHAKVTDVHRITDDYRKKCYNANR